MEVTVGIALMLYENGYRLQIDDGKIGAFFKEDEEIKK